MTNRNDSGMSLKDDIASIRTDPTFHDVVLVCADGVEIGACRAILASRSVVFKGMFYGNMQESISGRVSLQDIKSAAMHAVLHFIHTEDIDSNAVSVAVEVYRAASFFLLPKLMQLVLDQVHGITDFEVATSLLNDAVVSVPQYDNTEELYDAVFKPFCANSLAIGDLNGLSDQALDLFLAHTSTVGFKTSEYNLLLCVIEWAWARDTATPPAAERRGIFDDINGLPTELSIKIRLQSEPSRTSLLKLLDRFDLTLVCPHRLDCLIKSINVFDEMPRYMWAFCHHACENTKCSPAHPSRSRPPKLHWDQPRLQGVVFSEEGIVVEYLRSADSPDMQMVRASTKCSADQNGICKWTIVAESLGDSGFDVGFVEKYEDDSMYLFRVGWSLGVYPKDEGNDGDDLQSIYSKGREIVSNHGICITNGDVITFHLDLNNRTCSLSVNEHDYGVAWSDLPDNVNLYPAVDLGNGAKCRIKPYK